MPGFCIRDLTQITRGTLCLGAMPPIGGELEPLGRIVVESHLVQPGDVYWGLITNGENGANFAEEAFARGAMGVVVSGRRLEPWAGRFAVHVADSHAALVHFAEAKRAQFTGKVIVLVNELGTAVAPAMLQAVLTTEFSGQTTVFHEADSLALALWMLQVENEADFSILSLPLSAIENFLEKSALCHPDVLVINSPGFSQRTASNAAALVASTAHLLESLTEDCSAVLNGDDQELQNAARKSAANIHWFGRNVAADISATSVTSELGTLSFHIHGVRFRVPLWGRHYLSSALAAYGVGRLFHVPPRSVAHALSKFQLPAEHCEVLRGGVGTLINDLGETTPASLWSALELLREFPTNGRRIFVCDETAQAVENWGGFTALGNSLVHAGATDWLIACGSDGRALTEAALLAGMPRGRAIPCQTADETARILMEFVTANDVVLVKGQNKSALRGIIERLTAARRSRVAA